MYATTSQYVAAQQEIVDDARDLKQKFILPAATALRMALQTALTTAAQLEGRMWMVAHLDVDVFEGKTVKPIRFRGEAAQDALNDRDLFDNLFEMMKAA